MFSETLERQQTPDITNQMNFESYTADLGSPLPNEVTANDDGWASDFDPKDLEDKDTDDIPLEKPMKIKFINNMNDTSTLLSKAKEPIKPIPSIQIPGQNAVELSNKRSRDDMEQKKKPNKPTRWFEVHRTINNEIKKFDSKKSAIQYVKQHTDIMQSDFYVVKMEMTRIDINATRKPRKPSAKKQKIVKIPKIMTMEQFFTFKYKTNMHNILDRLCGKNKLMFDWQHAKGKRRMLFLTKHLYLDDRDTREDLRAASQTAKYIQTSELQQWVTEAFGTEVTDDMFTNAESQKKWNMIHKNIRAYPVHATNIDKAGRLKINQLTSKINKIRNQNISKSLEGFANANVSQMNFRLIEQNN